MPKRLSKDQREVLQDMIDAVNSEEVTNLSQLTDEIAYDKKYQFLLDWPIYSAGENMPGYMPDSPYCLFLTNRAARGYCRELEREGGSSSGYVSDYMQVTLREVLS